MIKGKMIKNKFVSGLLAAGLLILGASGSLAYADGNYSLPTSENLTITIDGGTTGNIFFGTSSPEFDVVYDNSSNETVSFTAVYSVFGYDSAMNKKLLESSSRVITVGANSKYTDTVMPNVTKFGVYSLDTEVKSALNGNTVKSVETDFSKSVIGRRNSSLGVNTHIPVYGDINQSLYLINNAGMSAIRDSIRWNEYEPVKGEKNLTPRIKKLISLSAEYGIDFLPIIYAKNSVYEKSDSAMVTTQEGLSAYSDFIRSLVSTDEFKNHIKAVEICNEPDTAAVTGIADASSKTDADQKIRAQRYTEVLKTAYNTIKNVNPSIKVGAFSTFSVATQPSFTFITEALKLMDKPYYDAITAHPYFTKDYTDEDTYHKYDTGYYLKNYYNPLFTGNFNVSERWYTEFGSTTDEGDTFAVENEYKQAVKNIRAYNTLKKDNFNSKLYLYNLEDSAVSEYHFGMLKASNTDVPYAAKPTYLAVSNLNNLVADATKVESVDNAENSRAFVDRYICPDRQVYMMYARYAGETIDAAYDLGNVVAYYDLFGNKLDKNEVVKNGKYHLTESPIYAVCGNDVQMISEEIEVFTVSGITASGNSNKMVSLSIVDESVDFDGIGDSGLVYFDQETTDEKGSFLFRFKLDTTKNYKAYVVSEDSNVPLCFTLSKRTKNDIQLNMYAGISKITRADIDTADFDKLKAEVILNGDVNAEDYRLYAAVYDKDRLVDIKSAEGSTAESVKSFDMSGMIIDKYDKIKLMLWNAQDGITPLCDVEVID